MPDWKTDLQKELEMAANAQARGNEGQARVCARRAAGIALREYFRRHGIQVQSPSAYDLLKELAEFPGTPEELRQPAKYLTLRVTEEFKLPVAVDLVKEARSLCGRLLPGELDV
jgi:HEPN domain-containing protein